MDTLKSLSHSECFVQTGALWLIRRDDVYGIANLKTLKGLDWPFEIFDHAELQRRYTGITVPSSCQGVLEPLSGALLARRAVAAVFADFVSKGASFVPSKVALDGENLLLGSHRLVFDRIVIAAGPWLPKLLPAVIGNRIKPTRQEIMFFGVPPGSQTFAAGRFPAWVDFTDSRLPYGFPDIEARDFKMSFDRHGAPVDPDTEERIPSASIVKEARQYLGRGGSQSLPRVRWLSREYVSTRTRTPATS